MAIPTYVSVTNSSYLEIICEEISRKESEIERDVKVYDNELKKIILTTEVKPVYQYLFKVDAILDKGSVYTDGGYTFFATGENTMVNINTAVDCGTPNKIMLIKKTI
jgi:hypothetical protein